MAVRVYSKLEASGFHGAGCTVRSIVEFDPPDGLKSLCITVEDDLIFGSSDMCDHIGQCLKENSSFAVIYPDGGVLGCVLYGELSSKNLDKANWGYTCYSPEETVCDPRVFVESDEPTDGLEKY